VAQPGTDTRYVCATPASVFKSAESLFLLLRPRRFERTL
jgi:hypothetical protein